jgi:hypothetical protein
VTDTSTGFTFHTFRDFNVAVTGSGPVCVNACSATIEGFLAGEGASHIGVNYIFASSGSSMIVEGAAAFGKAGPGAAIAKAAVDNWSSWTAGTNDLGLTAGFGQLSRIGPDNGFGNLSADSIRNFKEKLGPNFSFR